MALFFKVCPVCFAHIDEHHLGEHMAALHTARDLPVMTGYVAEPKAKKRKVS